MKYSSFESRRIVPSTHAEPADGHEFFCGHGKHAAEQVPVDLGVIGLHESEEEYGQRHSSGVQDADGHVQLHAPLLLDPACDPDRRQSEHDRKAERGEAEEVGEGDTGKCGMGGSGPCEREAPQDDEDADDGADRAHQCGGQKGALHEIVGEQFEHRSLW
jgi:hypothetical protein